MFSQIKQIVTPKLTAGIIFCVYTIFVVSAAPMYIVNRLGLKFSPLRNRTVLGLIFMENRETTEKVSSTVNNISIPLTAFAVIVVCTVTLVIELRRSSKWGIKSTQRACSRNRKVIKMVVTISTLFIVCFIPVNINAVATVFETQLWYTGKYVNVTIMLAGISFILESVNSSANIFIYYNMSSKYRDTFQEIFYQRKW